MYMNTKRHQTSSAGFTLIELLVVIAIIGMLASIILASLSTARLKAKDSVLLSEGRQLQTLIEQNFLDYGNYSNLQVGWVLFANPTCSGAPVTGTYAAQWIAICKQIVATADPFPASWGYGATPPLFYSGNSVSNANKYSFMIWLPSQQGYYCFGSSGSGPSTLPSWGSPGCFGNP
jgi:prepilin-type N-terminal cleavage/methylation domain-containing protein